MTIARILPCTLLIILLGAFAPATLLARELVVPKQAQEDQIWTQTWRTVQQGLSKYLNEQAGATITDQLSKASEYEDTTIRLFLRYVLSYGRPTLGPERVRYRYPHYNLDALKQDFDLLAQQGLLVDADIEGMYGISDAGESLLNSYWQLRKERADTLPEELKAPFGVIASILDKVVIGAILMDGGNNTLAGAEKSSINWRHKSWQAREDQLEPVSLSQEYYADYTAFNNDNAHYRFDREPHKFTETKSLGPVAKELFAGMRNERTRSLDYCTSHTRWRQPFDACEIAFNELIEAGLIETQGDNYAQSALGKEVFQRAQALADMRFYYPWAVLNLEEYQAYKAAITSLEALLTAPPSSVP